MRFPALAVIAAAVVASCATIRSAIPPDPHNPVVFVIDSQVVVDQEPLVFAKGDRGPIVWKLHGASGLTFADRGITVESDEFSCAPEGATAFVCQNRHTRPGRYKYTIRVLSGGKPLEPLDPFIYNY